MLNMSADRKLTVKVCRRMSQAYKGGQWRQRFCQLSLTSLSIPISLSCSDHGSYAQSLAWYVLYQGTSVITNVDAVLDYLVTGSSSGFGRSLVELALAKGDNVLATCRKPSVLDSLKAEFASSRLVVQALDVTKPADISNAFVKAKEAFGRVDVVFNNAGYGLLAEVEGTPDDVARQVFETNFWGAANVNREAVRFFREANAAGAGGRLIVMSSFVGLRPLPCSGYYTASKHGTFFFLSFV